MTEQNPAQRRQTIASGVEELGHIVAAAQAVVAMLEGNLYAHGFAKALTFLEADKLAELAHTVGRDDIAQQFMVAWAEGDPETARERQRELGAWGILPSEEGSDRPWAIKHAPR